MTGYAGAVGADPQMAETGPPAYGTARLAAGRRRMLGLAGFTLLTGLVITVVLTVLSHTVYVHNQRHLLRLRLTDAAALVTTALPAVETPLASGAALADATGGSPAKFRAFAETYVGTGHGFASLSLWDTNKPGRPLAVVGPAPRLLREPGALPGFFSRVYRSPTLSVIGLLNLPQPALGYGYSTPGHHYAVYAETNLPLSRYAPAGKGSPFAGLHYALYLRQAKPADLLATNVHKLPLTGGVSKHVPFGDTTVVLSLVAPTSLAGSLPLALPWIIAIGGTLLSLAAAAGAWRLSERRLRAETLAGKLEVVAQENRQLYAEQRSIAQTLQHALLPEELPQLPGIQAAGQYVAGERSVDIGGDWYDVLALADGSLLVVVGDVSGRGLPAATTMASLRFAIHAYAAEEQSPEVILGKLSGLLSLTRQKQLATILCIRVDPRTREATLASAGHLPPLLLSEEGPRFLELPVGVPVGVDAAPGYRSMTVAIPARATMLAFTDGLVERRGEQLDAGLDRLRQVAAERELALPVLLSKLVADLSAGQAKDDIAIVGLRWTN